STGGAAPALKGLGYTGGDDAFGKGKAAKESEVALEELSRPVGYSDSDDGDAPVVVGDLSVLDSLRPLDAPERAKGIEQECHRILTSCRRRPNERPRDMFFRFYGDNPFELAVLEPQSTFSVDVDTASYALARRYINEGHIPEKAQVRTE